MILKDIFKDPESDEYGQFVQFPPYPSNKQICDAKALLRDSIAMTEQKLGKTAGHVKWIVVDTTKDDDGNEIGVVGYRVVFRDVA